MQTRVSETQIVLRLPVKLLERLDQLAQDTGRSRSSVVRELVRSAKARPGDLLAGELSQGERAR